MLDQMSSSALVEASVGDLPRVLERFVEEDPATGLEIVRALGERADSYGIRGVAARLLAAADADIALDLEVDGMVARARSAQRAFERWSEWRVDELLSALSEALTDSAEDLAIATVEESGRGNVTDKTLKNRFASRTIFESLVGETAQGILSVDATRKITELASPMGVVFAVVPQTSPVATAIFKTLTALKTRNGLILSFPRRARGVAHLFSSIVREVLCSHSV